MEDLFLPHNLHWQSVEQFTSFDPQLHKLKKQIFVHEPALIKKIPTKIPGIYTLGGGRQIGKTTLLKQWMKKLFEEGVPPKAVVFFTGEVIQDHFQLIHLVQEYLKDPSTTLRYIIIDEVTYIKNWDQGVKYLADTGILEDVVMVLTGSDLTLMQEARMRFPGRRGSSEENDFHLYPLSFFEFIQLKHQNEPSLELLYREFDQYLQHGGFLTAINSIAATGAISPAIYRVYSDWIRGDVLKRGKSESFLREFLAAVVKSYGSQVTWNSLASHTSIDHPITIQSYAHLLEAMDVLFIQSALMEEKLLAAPKKAKKIVFKDPFIYHAVNFWLFKKSEVTPFLVESTVVDHYQRFYPCFYIKAEGEVDVAYIDQDKFYPVEVKWTNQLRTKDLKQIKKYKNSLILAKTRVSGFLENVPTEPLPLHLYELGKRFI